MRSDKSYRYGVISITVFALALLSTQTQSIIGHRNMINIGSFLILVSAISGLVGFVNAMRGIKEPRTKKKVIGLILNSFSVLLFLSLIAANVYDIMKMMT